MDPLIQVIFFKILLVAAILTIAALSDSRSVRIGAAVAAILLVGSVVLTFAPSQL